MNERDFAYWLTGFVELTQGQTPNPAQWKSIKEHLDLVFKKVTPKVGEVTVDVKVDTKDAQKAVDGLKKSYEDLVEQAKKLPEPPIWWAPGYQPHWTPGTVSPGIVTC